MTTQPIKTLVADILSGGLNTTTDILIFPPDSVLDAFHSLGDDERNWIDYMPRLSYEAIEYVMTNLMIIEGVVDQGHAYGKVREFMLYAFGQLMDFEASEIAEPLLS